MKYIKTFESFGVNETLDMFMMPVDPIKGAAEVWTDILDGIWEGVQKFFKGAKDLFLKSLDNLCEEFFKVVDFSKGVLEKISKYFGATAQDLTFKQLYYFYIYIRTSTYLTLKIITERRTDTGINPSRHLPLLN
jgi:hypothetical protein